MLILTPERAVHSEYTDDDIDTMSRNLMDQDFGSEEEDDDFNPAPAEESGNEDDVKVCLSCLQLAPGVSRIALTRRGGWQ